MSQPPDRNSRLAASAFCAALVAATLAPVAQNFTDARADGFPFSYYPMFSAPVGDTYKVAHAVGIDGDGREHVIPYRYLGRGGLNEVRTSAARAARKEPRDFCERIAARLAADRPEALRGVREIAVRTGAYDVKAFYDGRLEPRSLKERARCRVPG